MLTGNGRAFSAGNDLVEMSSGKPITKKPGNGFAGLTDRTTCNKPIIAAVNGIAMGGGCELAIACDIILASDQAKFALPEVKVGLSAGAGGTANMHRLIGCTCDRSKRGIGKSPLTKSVSRCFDVSVQYLSVVLLFSRILPPFSCLWTTRPTPRPQRYGHDPHRPPHVR